MRRLVLLLTVGLAACSATQDNGPGGDGAGANGVGGGTGGSSTTSSSTDGGGGGASGPDNVQIIVEPSDHAQGIIDAITGATSSVHMTMYLLSNQGVIDALIAQRHAGHEVKVVLNQTFPQNGGSNAAVASQLSGAGISVVWGQSKFTYTHEKCVIIDKKVAWIMTMNLTASSPTGNREFLAIDRNAADVAEAEAIFQADFNSTAIAASGPLVVAPDNARVDLMQLIQDSQHKVDVEVESFSDANIVTMLTMAADRGVKVRVVLSDETPSTAGAQCITELKAHNVPIVAVSNPYIHAKAIVVDGTRAYVGSENLTYNSLVDNRELGVIITAPAAVGTVGTRVANDFALGKAL